MNTSKIREPKALEGANFSDNDFVMAAYKILTGVNALYTGERSSKIASSMSDVKVTLVGPSYTLNLHGYTCDNPIDVLRSQGVSWTCDVSDSDGTRVLSTTNISLAARNAIGSMIEQHLEIQKRAMVEKSWKEFDQFLKD